LKLRKLAAVAALSGALVIGGAATANAYPFVPQPDGVVGISVAASQLPQFPELLTTAASQNFNGGNVSATIDIPVEYFYGLYLNDVAVAEANYTVTSGSTVITLNAGYLSSLGAGNHVFRAVFDGGVGFSDSAVPFTVVVPSAATGGNNQGAVQHPATGPAALLYGVGGILLAGGGATAVAASKRRKAENV